MKKAVLLLYLLFFGIVGYGQSDQKKITCSHKPTTRDQKTITVDLAAPSLKDSLNISSKWLSVRARQLLVIKLKNGNPLKYTYKIGTQEISFFNNQNPDLAEVKKDTGISSLENNSKRKKEKINDLIERNQDLNKSIDRLNTEADVFYDLLKGLNSLKESDIIIERKKLLQQARANKNYSDDQLTDLNLHKKDSGYSEVYKMLDDTKEKAKNSLKNIMDKFYSFSLEVFTLPMDVQGKNIDAVEFRLTRFDRETKEEDKDFAPHPYNVWLRGGFKIDVSAGIFFTSLFDDTFDKKDDPAIADNKIITKKNLGEYDFAFGSSINIHSRWNSWLNMGGNLGIAFTTNQKFQVLTGINFIFGRQERIILTTGLAMGKVERLAGPYQEGSSYNLGAEGTIPTESRFKFGHFFGITYNLSKVKKISLDKGIE